LATDGILNVYKPVGPTSFAVVARLRRLLRLRRIGHAGTLDPLASGVLLLLLGRATRLSCYLQALPKTYRVGAYLGKATTTYDEEGEVVWEADPWGIDEGAVHKALAEMTGRFLQQPPSYSAVKVKGKPAYVYARSGQSVQPPPRWVEVYRFQLLEFRLPELFLEVECSQGTYVRSLVHELGLKLGCGAYVRWLMRTAVGPFTVEESIPLSLLEEEIGRAQWSHRLLPLDAGLSYMLAISLGPEEVAAVVNGRPICRPGDGERARAYGPDGALVAILRWDPQQGLWRPETVFAP